MDSEKKIIGRCPFCGGNVVKTCKGYRCENNTGEHPSCVLNINAIIGNRKMNDGEIAEFLEKRRILLDGFSTKEGNAVSFWTAFPPRKERLSRQCWNLLMTVQSICSLLSAGVRTAAAKYVWEQGLSTVQTTAIRRNRVPLPSGGI